MNFLPYIGFIDIGFTRLTFLLIPVILAAQNDGLLTGITTGAAFGTVSFIKSYTNPNLTSFCFNNPIVSVLPRVLIGVASYYSFKFFCTLLKNVKNKTAIASLLSAIIGVLTNTVLVLGLMSLFYGGSTAGEKTINMIIKGLIVSNSLPELIVCMIAVPAITLALTASRKNSSNTTKEV
jgi:uncharacterized membrane protein